MFVYKNLYACINICLCVHLYLYVCMCLRKFVHMYICENIGYTYVMWLSIYLCMYVYFYVDMCVRMYDPLYVRIYVSMYAFTCVSILYVSLYVCNYG